MGAPAYRFRPRFIPLHAQGNLRNIRPLRLHGGSIYKKTRLQAYTLHMFLLPSHGTQTRKRNALVGSISETVNACIYLACSITWGQNAP